MEMHSSIESTLATSKIINDVDESAGVYLASKNIRRLFIALVSGATKRDRLI